jgi:H+/Cl- antiporter ClcA
MKKVQRTFLLGLIAAFLGGLVGAVSAGFLHFIEWGQELLWKTLPPNLPLQALLICTLGGLLVGLCQKYLGDHPQGITEATTTLRKTGRLEYQHLPHGLTTASISLIFGASLGPEAAIMDLIGGLGTWVGDILRNLRLRFELPLSTQPANRLTKALRSWPTLTAFAVGAVAFSRVLNGLYSGGLLKLSAPFQWTDLLWSLPLGLLGATGGGLYLALQTWTRKLVAPLQRKPILRGILGGTVLGLIASFLPLTLFSGQHLLQPTYDQAAQLGFWLLLLTALARLFLTSLLLATGWKGGQFLPIMFGSAALGLSVSVLFPIIPAPVAALAAMAALTAVVLPKPLIALILMALMFPLQYVGISIVAIGTVMLGKQLRQEFNSKKQSQTIIVDIASS